MFSTVNIPANVSVIPVDTRLIPKVLYLPTVSTNSGRFLLFKDYYGTSSNSTFTISTTGTDLIDDYNFKYTFSNAFGGMSFVSDGLRSWRLMDYYNGLNTPSVISYSTGLYVNSYANTGSIPNSNGPTSYTGGTNSWGSLLNTTYVGGIFAGSNSSGPTNYMYYGNSYGIYPTGNTNFSLIVSGYIYSAGGGTIQFRIVTDDGFRLDFNNANAINQWQQQGATTYTSGVLTLPAGYTPIIMRWYDTGGGGNATMEYNINSAGYTSNGTGVYYYLASNITQT